jgi:serine/threonine-protein kinase
MTPERWQAVEHLYHAALALAPHERAAFLIDACAGDDLLRRAVDALLTRQPQAVDFLEAPAWQSVAAALAESLTPIVGRVIGSFEVVSHLGSGGMGEVYRARDRRLGRDVALKFLTPALASDAEARGRLRREALAASALNHPYICTLHDIVEDEGRPVLVMEIVEGEPLSAVIPKEGLPIETVVRYGEQLADALAHAHAHGIIHRDLKPANIVVTPDGRAKVLDFGIARQMRAEDLAAVTQDHTALTDAGSIAGTLRYLAPDVLAGQPADARSDIWALGVVLYEMATGMRPFEGTTGVALTGAILHEPMAPLPSRVPATLRAILQKCLAKEPSQRYQSAAEVRAVLEMMRPDPAAAVKAAGVASDTTPRLARSRVARWSAVAGIAGVAVIAAWSVTRQAPAQQLSRVTITLGPNESFVGDAVSVAISPEGRRVAYVARRGEQQLLYVRLLDRFEAMPLAGTEGASQPFFSPDGRWLGFFAGGKLRKVPVEGGAPVTLCDAPRGRGADWGPDDSIIFAPDGNTGLSQIAAAGGVPRPITTLDGKKGELSHRAPQILPGGKTVLFTVFTGEELTPSNRALSLVTGQTRTLVEIGSWARYVPGDHLIYVSNGVAMTAPFDPKRLTVTGPATPLTEDVRQSMAPPANLWQFAVSAEGSLVFIPGGRANQRSLVWVDRHGVATPLGTAVRAYQQLRLSPDGQRLALTIREPAGPDIWIYELTHDRLTRLTSEGNNLFPVWSPDNTHIAFASGRFGPHNMFVKAADGTGPTERLLTSDKVQRPRSWSPDGRMLNFSQDDPMPDIWTLSLEQPPTPRPIVQLPGYQTSSRISPDGRWLAYTSEESGQFETYVTRFPDGVGKSQVSSGGGTQPVWARNGRELFYLKDDKLMVVEVDTRSTFVAGKPVLLFQGQSLLGPAGDSTYDVSLDGQRLVMIQTSGASVTANQVNVILGWSDELTRQARAGQH